jgi:hypothetical protein
VENKKDDDDDDDDNSNSNPILQKLVKIIIIIPRKWIHVDNFFKQWKFGPSILILCEQQTSTSIDLILK